MLHRSVRLQTRGASSYSYRTSPVTYPCLLSAFLLPAKRISRRYAESPEGTGIRSTGPLGLLFDSLPGFIRQKREWLSFETTRLPWVDSSFHNRRAVLGEILNGIRRLANDSEALSLPYKRAPGGHCCGFVCHTILAPLNLPFSFKRYCHWWP